MSQSSPKVIAEISPMDASVVEDRRLRVQAMKLRRLSPKAIAAVLNEPESVIEADLEFLRQQNTAKFGPTPSIDPSQEIGWAVADFEEMESVAWLEFHSLKQEAQQRRLSPMFVARARQGWIRTAAMMRVLRLKLLAEHGYLLPQASRMSTPGSQIPRADELRAMLRAEGLLLEVTAAADTRRLLADQTPEERQEEAEDLPMVVDPVAQWMDDGGFFGADE